MARHSDQANVRHGYESEDCPGWLLRLTAACAEDPAKAVRILTGALLACGGWVLTRSHEKGAFAVDFEFARAACVEVYAVLIGCGLELSRESHLRMAELCHCTKNLIETRAFEIARIDLVVYCGRSQSAGDDPSMVLCG
ncbi:MAG: hypothetical protein JOZ83_10160 [Silvibacterium sp.]|nr:hypothetical protein [Silvibacterium sp.]